MPFRSVVSFLSTVELTVSSSSIVQVYWYESQNFQQWVYWDIISSWISPVYFWNCFELTKTHLILTLMYCFRGLQGHQSLSQLCWGEGKSSTKVNMPVHCNRRLSRKVWIYPTKSSWSRSATLHGWMKYQSCEKSKGSTVHHCMDNCVFTKNIWLLMI